MAVDFNSYKQDRNKTIGLSKVGIRTKIAAGQARKIYAFLKKKKETTN